MIPLIIAIMIGISGTTIVWSLRAELRARWEKDVAWLEHTIWRFTPEPFNARPYVAGFYISATVLLVVLLVALPMPLLGLIIWCVVVLLPKVLIDRAWQKRRKQIDEQLPASVLQMSSSVASGMSLVQSIERLADRSPAPINTEFRIIANYWNLGSDFSATIEEAKRRLRLPNFTLFASAILINQRMGGNITQTLDRLAFSLEAVERMRRELHAATSEGRTNIKVLVIAPFIMLGFVAVIDPPAVGMLLTRPLGHILLGVAALLTAAGTLWAWRIVRSDV
jgi:tight adherence protein B